VITDEALRAIDALKKALEVRDLPQIKLAKTVLLIHPKEDIVDAIAVILTPPA
jgi:hypothetical protein